MDSEIINCDTLVIGAGIAGIRASIEAHDLGGKVILVNKGAFGRDGASTWMAGGGYEVALYPPDTLDEHIKDTIVDGKFIGNQKLIVKFLSMSAEGAKELFKWGVRWKKDENGNFVRRVLPGHNHGRCITLKQPGLYAGLEYRKALPAQIKKRKDIRVIEDTFITDLLTDNKTVVGAVGIDLKSNKFLIIRAKSTILATGGAMQCYKFSDSGCSCTGDGIAIAFRAGAKLMDMEFMQFLPALAIWPSSVVGDITPYNMLVNLGGIFRNNQAARFMERYYPIEKDLATRDMASKAICAEVRAGRGSPNGGVYLGFNHIPRNLLDIYFNNNKGIPFLAAIQAAGIDLHYDAIEVAPGAHYTHGGCQINESCETSLPGLYAVGEAAAGLDGADRLAGNAIPFCMGTGATAGRAVSKRNSEVELPQFDMEQIKELKSALAPKKIKDGINPRLVKNTLKEIMQTHAVFNRSKSGLENVLKIISKIQNDELERLMTERQNGYNLELVEALEAKNMLTVSEMLCKSALMRDESRGCHERLDYPTSREEWLKNIIIQKDNRGKMGLTLKDVEFPYIQPR